MSNYIVAFDMSDNTINRAANFLNKELSKNSTVYFADVNQAEEWPDTQNGCTLYLINHANGTQFGEYSNPENLFKENENLTKVYKKASTVVLVACSTANEADLILSNGFQAATFAKNLKKYNTGKTIVAAVGPVIPTENGLFVKTPNNAIGFASNEGWVKF